MSGTAWTEPGRGATGRQIMAAMDIGFRDNPNGGCYINGETISRRQWNDARRVLKPPMINGLTNLRLTGAPLTADDIRRIEQMEVTR